MDQLQLIQDTLKDDEFKQLEEIKEELVDAWHKRQIFRTETEARFSVLNDYKTVTNASKYWQSIREQTVHFDQLTKLSFELRRKKIDLHENADMLKDAVGYERDRLEVKRDELLFHIASGEQIAKDRAREIIMWSKLKKKFNDGSFDDKDVNTHQRESLFRSVFNRAKVATHDISPEERLSIEGLLNGLKDEEVNKRFIESLKK